MKVLIAGGSMFAVILTCAAHAGATQERFRSTIDVVKLDVTIEDGDRPVRGLTAADFSILDAQSKVDSIEVHELDDVPLDLIAVVQPFASHFGDQIPLFDRAMRALLSSVRPVDRFGQVLASTPPKQLRALTADPIAIDDAALRGDTQVALWDAVGSALAMFDDSDRRRLVLVVSDGLDRLSALDADMLSSLAARARPHIVFLGASPSLHVLTTHVSVTPPGGGATRERWIDTYENQFPDPELRKVADLTGGRILDLRSNDPKKTVPALLTQLRSGYLISFPSSTVKGWHPVAVKLLKHRGTVTARAGYFVQ